MAYEFPVDELNAKTGTNIDCDKNATAKSSLDVHPNRSKQYPAMKISYLPRIFRVRPFVRRPGSPLPSRSSYHQNTSLRPSVIHRLPAPQAFRSAIPVPLPKTIPLLRPSGNPETVLWHNKSFDDGPDWVEEGKPVGQFYGLGGSWTQWNDLAEITMDLGSNTPSRQVCAHMMCFLALQRDFVESRVEKFAALGCFCMSSTSKGGFETHTSIWKSSMQGSFTCRVRHRPRLRSSRPTNSRYDINRWCICECNSNTCCPWVLKDGTGVMVGSICWVHLLGPSVIRL